MTVTVGGNCVGTRRTKRREKGDNPHTICQRCRSTDMKMDETESSEILITAYVSDSQPWVRVHPGGYETGHLGVREKNGIMAGKGTYVKSVRQDTSQKL